jgi:ATP-binding protein involved in chromosome partitioning
MPQQKDLKSILKNIQFTDDAKVMKQLVDQSLQVKIRMGRIRRKIAIMSGKGGVGKSTTTVNLALAFARAGHRVGILDVDLNGPCVPRMLGVSGPFTITPEGAIPKVGPYGIKIASMDFFLKEKGTPVRWKGPMDLSPIWLGMLEMNVIRDFLADIIWGEIDYLFVDLPPGAAADKPPVIANFLPELDGAIVVTTPSEVAKTVVLKSIAYARDIGMKTIGLIENMGHSVCPNCQTQVPLFIGGCEEMVREWGIPLLAKIPFDAQLAQSSDQGVLLSSDHPIARQFDQMVASIEAALAGEQVGTLN